VQPQGPRGTVNGTDDAGLHLLANAPFSPGRVVLVGQVPIDAMDFDPGDEQSVFYGVGTLTNGEPGDIGPTFTSLTNVMDVPWANSPDTLSPPFGNTAARLVSGTFAAGVTPGFFAGTSGNVFTTLGTSIDYGTIAQASLTTIIRTNFSGTLFPDYNEDGVVDAADYVMWRKGDPAADGNNNGMIDIGDYNLWRLHFGELAPGAGATVGLSSGAIPEPASAILLAVGALVMLFAGDWLTLRSLRSKVCLSPSPPTRNEIFLREGDETAPHRRPQHCDFCRVFRPFQPTTNFRLKIG
jgi:hypothetical protein